MDQLTNQLAQRLQEVFIDGTWIANTNYKNQIDGLDWEDAIKKFENLNSIALLVFHANYYLGGLIEVFLGGPLEIRDKYSFDMPDIRSEGEWLEMKKSFLNNANRFIEEVKKFDDNKLNEPFVDVKYGSYHRNIEGIIEHSYYHLGQIVLIGNILKSYKKEPSKE